MRILGIDPGSVITGFGVIEQKRGQQRYITSGCIRTTAREAFHVRLHQIYNRLMEIMQEHRPDAVAVEQVFVRNNPASALKLGHARGIALLVACQAGLPIAEYTPRAVKQAVVGHGSASKHQVQHMVRALLKLPGLPAVDAADALAIAVCHGHILTRVVQ